MQTLSRVEVMERMTAADFFCDAPEDRKAELIDGVMIMPSPPLVVHERMQGFLSTLLRLYVEEKEIGEVFGSRTAVELELFYAPEPDILFVSKERLHIIGEKGILGAPDFVIEILSASTAMKDQGEKRILYEKFGVKEYWVVNPLTYEVLRYFFREGKFGLAVPADLRNPVEVSLFPDLFLSVKPEDL